MAKKVEGYIKLRFLPLKQHRLHQLVLHLDSMV